MDKLFVSSCLWLRQVNSAGQALGTCQIMISLATLSNLITNTDTKTNNFIYSFISSHSKTTVLGMIISCVEIFFVCHQDD